MADIQNYLFIRYKDEYQKSKWTIESGIFISFIWSWSELWNRNNNKVYTKKTKIGMTRFRRLYYNSSTPWPCSSTKSIVVWSPKSQIQSHKSKIPSQKSKVQSTKFKVPSPNSHVLSPKFKVQSPKAPSLESKVWSPKTGSSNLINRVPTIYYIGAKS